MRYFQIMARIGGSLVHIEGPQDSRAKAMSRIRKLSTQKPQFILAEVGTEAVGFAEKVPRKKRR